MGAPMAQQDNTDSSSTDVDNLQKPFAVNSNNDSSLTTYLSLIQQYLAVFMVDNAAFLAERCVAQHPSSQEAVYMLALCYYRSNAPKRAQQVITTRQTAAMHLTPSMQYLLSVCAYDLKDYERAEDALLRQCRATFKQNRPTATAAQDNQNIINGATVAGTMDDWILTTTVSICCSYLVRQDGWSGYID
jgi:predicted Zn-dependent protease